MCKSEAVLTSVRNRTMRSIERGEDGFIDPTMLSFDVGLCRRKVRLILAEALEKGIVEKRSQGPGKACYFRFIGSSVTV